ncbi:MAG: phenylacetate-CoA oxygenase subunit PaaC [Bacteroidetes bacterium]|nr:phenylacetate-CoA oxygenase subunit PaaC [Bacteroidota bacterium]
MTNKEALFNYCLRLGDNNLILGHRLSEWTGRGPMLEEEMALCNIALDLLGQANSFLQYAAKVEAKGRSEDDLAYLRNDREFFNTLLAEHPNGDYAFTIMRQFLMSAFDFYFYDELKKSSDETLAGIAAKAHKEITYHLRHSSNWAERLGDGTEESHSRIQNALDELWRFTAELFEMNEVDGLLLKEKISVDLKSIKPKWEKLVNEVLQRATLKIPVNTFMQRGSRDGKHTEHLGYLLAEMQHLHRTHPGVQW